MHDVRETLDASPISRAQVIAITLTTLINAVDAFDVLAMSFVAPELAKQWHINRAALGVALSSGFAGMVFGSFVISPLADRFGRRRVVLAMLLVMATGMLMAAFSRSVPQLALWRVVTGVGIGALVPINTPLAVEYANAAQRRLALAAMSIGFPLGGTLGGVAASALLNYASWHWVFAVGAAGAAALFAAAYVWLPEPPAFLLARRPANAIDRINDYLRRCGHPPVTELPTAVAHKTERSGYAAILSPPYRAATLVVSLANFLQLITVYYVLSWMPQLVADLGYSSAFATLTAAVSALCGVVSTLFFGVFGSRQPQRMIAAVNLIGLAATTALFGLGHFSPAVLVLLVGLLGVFLYAGGVALYGVIIDTFSPAIRTTGTGFAMGVGRISGVIAPALAGQLFFVGMGRLSVSVLMALCALAAAGLIAASARFAPRQA